MIDKPVDERYSPKGDWRDQREVHKLLEQDSAKGVDPADWEYVGRVIKAHRQVMDRYDHPPCAHCGEPIRTLVIRCLDCKAPLHDNGGDGKLCAEKHFWPNGRPLSDPRR